MNGRIEFEGWFQTSSAAPLWIYCEYNNCWTFAIWLHSYWAIKHTPLFDTTIQSYRAFKDTINQGEEGPKTQVNLLCKQCIVQRKLWFVCTGRRLTLPLTSTNNHSFCSQCTPCKASVFCSPSGIEPMICVPLDKPMTSKLKLPRHNYWPWCR